MNGLRLNTLVLFGLIAIALPLVSIPNGVVQASAGNLDMSFGAGGMTTADFGGSAGARARAAVLQPDGKLVVVGTSEVGFALIRYTLDGRPDPTFGSGGKAMTYFTQSVTFANDVALQNDGKIIVAGVTGVTDGLVPPGGFALARFNSDGSLDNSFGTGGKVVTAFQSSSSSANTLALQADGKLVVAGYTYNAAASTESDFAIARYTSDGRLDSTFGTGGKVIVDFFRQNDFAFDVAIQPDQKVVVTGMATSPLTGSNFALLRLRGDGTLDRRFGAEGKVTADLSTFGEVGYSMAVQADGKIVVGGETENPLTGFDFTLVRFTSDGSLDLTFGSGGKAVTDFDRASDVAYAIALTPDQKIVAAGVTQAPARVGPSQGDFAIAQYSPDGRPDLGFGIGGKVTTDFGASDSAYAVVVQPDGRIIAAGLTAHSVGSPPPAFAIARYESGLPLPVIRGAAKSAKRLIVAGENFGDGAVLLVNDERQKTANDATSPTTILVAKKAGKKVQPGDRLRVQNRDGTFSAEFVFTGS
jgi:uncharacterized delta-60 repeat protein